MNSVGLLTLDWKIVGIRRGVSHEQPSCNVFLGVENDEHDEKAQ